MTNLAKEKIVASLLDCLCASKFPLNLHEPNFNGNEWLYVKECLDTKWVSSVGKFVDRFEQELANFTGAKHAIVTANGTAALHIAFLLANVKPMDEVLVPTLTFVATCNAICYCNATPHFVDSEITSFGIDAEKLDSYLKDIAKIKNNVCINSLTGRPIRALCVTHIFGHPADLDQIADVCARYKITLLEDAAEALGSYYKKQHVGNYGLLGILSFNGNKIITTGGGGAILTSNTELAKYAKHITTTAKLPHKWLFVHDQVGYNYRLPNINAALGCAQMEKLSFFLVAKRKLANLYAIACKHLWGIKFVKEPNYAESNYWLNALILDAQFAHERDNLLELLNAKGINSRPAWNLMHTLSMFQNCPKMDLSIAGDLAARLINIPSSVFLVK